MDNTPRDYSFISREFPDRQNISIYYISDLHTGAKNCYQEQFEKFVDWISKQDNAYLVLGGDLMNNATRSSVSNVFGETMRPCEQKRWIANKLTPVRDKILCGVAGNHEMRSGKDADDDPMYDIFSKLDLEDIYRPYMAILRLRFGDKNADGRANPTYIFAVHHGNGGGKKTGSAVNNAEDFAGVFDGIDGLFVGHTHKAFNTFPQKLCVDSRNNKITLKPFFVYSASSWLQYSDYAIRFQLKPASTANEITQRLDICGNKKQVELRNFIKY